MLMKDKLKVRQTNISFWSFIPAALPTKLQFVSQNHDSYTKLHPVVNHQFWSFEECRIFCMLYINLQPSRAVKIGNAPM